VYTSHLKYVNNLKNRTIMYSDTYTFLSFLQILIEWLSILPPPLHFKTTLLFVISPVAKRGLTRRVDKFKNNSLYRIKL